MPGLGDSRQSLTSLGLEVLYYFGGWYDVFYVLLQFLVFIYKGLELPYPSNNYEVEFTYLFLFAIIEPTRLFLGSKGNKTENSGPLVFSTILTVFVALFFLYYLLWQTYVVKLEQFLNSLALLFSCAQGGLGVFTIMSFQNAARLA
ncbi:hypothetical protein CYMTET_39564 [Cymbomonas tetramitiformis]|uniref:Transmembrane protein 80 n=1 Tax=Cymbomonas tetramitiformis TaxID=36881 RepID=A0AAE0CB73_9CHLO|nr:hypothetical protein CYMTET_39564 [Cymbomonas tetramitiformis]